MDYTVPPAQSQELYGSLVATGVACPSAWCRAGHSLPDSEDEFVHSFLNGLLSAPLLLGDLNCDSVINPVDISPFSLAVDLGETAYLQQYPDCNWHAADFTGDGLVTEADIDGFVAALGAAR